jgi:ADP-ribose pyrophosphatase
MEKISTREVVFTTPWFNLVSKHLAENTAAEPYYALESADYVSILALTAQTGEVVMVRQYRPAVEQLTLELPAGHVEAGQTPEEAARQELLEETGYQADRMELLGCLRPDTGRLANRMWCFFAGEVQPVTAPHTPEEGLEMVLLRPEQLFKDMIEGQFDIALQMAVLLLAVLQQKLPLSTLVPLVGPENKDS